MSSVSESIIGFVENGQFRSLPFGMEQQKLINKLGKSESYLTLSKKDKRKGLIKYGICEFHFGISGRELNLEGIVFQPNSSPADSHKFKLETDGIIADVTYLKVLDWLKEKQIDFEETLDEIDQNIIETSQGVRFYFFDEEENQQKEDWLLNKMVKFKKESHNPFADLLKAK